MARKSKAKKPATKDDPNTLVVGAAPGEDQSVSLARTLLRPSVQGGITLKDYTTRLGNTDLMGLIEELSHQAKVANEGDLTRAEGMLIIQAHTLDAIFNDLARRAIHAEYMTQVELYLRLALKAQSQCRATVETLAAIKNPQPVAFVRQANIAHNQQVNNGAMPEDRDSRARENENRQNKLLETNDGERLDSGTPGAASNADPALATLGPFDRPKNAGR